MLLLRLLFRPVRPKRENKQESKRGDLREDRTKEKDPLIKVKQFGYALLLLGLAITKGYSQDSATEYVAPPDAGPKGKAPRMKVRLLNDGEPTKQYSVIFYQGDEAFSGLLEFAQKYHVTSAHFTAIGAVNGATLGGLILNGKCTRRF